jgi:hypothetical protein
LSSDFGIDAGKWPGWENKREVEYGIG